MPVSVIRRYIQLASGVVFYALLALMPTLANAATISFSPSSGSFAVGKEFTVRVIVEPGTDKINASDGTITFDSSTLSVTAVTKDGSLFSLWTADPTFSNSDGTVTYSGGTPTPTTKTGTVITLTMKAKKVGTGTISLSKGSVLAADGKGTDVYKAGTGASYTITAAAAEPPPPPPDDASVSDAAGGIVPLAPLIASPTHPKPENWYSTSTATFTWKPPSDALAIRTLLSDNATTTPTQLQKGIINAQTVTGIADGVWYFYVQYKNDSGWGPAASMKVSIDTVPPGEFDVALATPGAKGEVAKFAFTAEDTLSGIDRYEILFGTSTVATAHLKDITNGTYPIPPQAGGPTDVTIRAYDKAGNVRAVKRTLTLPAVAKLAAKDDAPTAPTNPSLWEHLLVLLLALITGSVLTVNNQMRKAAIAERARLLAHVLVVREKNDRIFTAMREEFEQMIQDFDPKPQLTPEERGLLEGVREVIEISEGLIDVSIEDLKKDVRGK